MSTMPLIEALCKAALDSEELPAQVQQKILDMAAQDLSNHLPTEKIAALISALYDFDPYAECGCFGGGTGVGEITAMTEDLVRQLNS